MYSNIHERKIMKINIDIFFVSFIILSLSITQVHAKRKRPDRRTYKPLIQSVKKTHKPVVKTINYLKEVDIIVYKDSSNLNSSFPVTVRILKNYKEGIQ